MRAPVRRSRWLWWLGIVLAGASLFAPGGRDLPTATGPLQHPLTAILYPTVGLDALVDQPVVRVGQHAEPTWPGRPAAAWTVAAAVLAVALLTVAARTARSVAGHPDRRVPSGRRRGPPRPVWMPRARPARLLAPA